MRLSYEGDLETAQRLLGPAQQELARLEARLQSTGLDSGKFLIGFPHTPNYAYGHILPGGFKQIHIIASSGTEEVLPLEDEELALPDFLSGWAIDGRYQQDPDTGRSAVIDFRPTAPCAALFPDEVTIGGGPVERLAIEVGPGFAGYFADRGPLPRSQVDLLYPTAYSGAMCKWVQAMLGFGKKPTQTSIYDDVEPEIIAPDPLPDITAWETKLRDEGMRVWYDFRFSRTHGIHFASDGKPWLVEISMNRGVVAMPLPIDARTTTEDFRLKVENLEDVAGLTVLDEFGGFPTGEPFPSSGALWDAYVRAGRIIELAPPEELAEFYQHLYYSSAMGWSFSGNGHEAHNTAYRFDPDFMQSGVHFAIAMSIGETQAIEPDDSAQELKTALSAMRADATRRATFEAVMWKIDRLTEEEVDDALRDMISRPARDVYDEIDEMVLEPLAPANSNVDKVSDGRLYWPAKFGPQIKFPEPLLGYLVTHDLRPEGPVVVDEPICDTTVHVFFVGQELKWAKYFHDPRAIPGGWFGDDEFICTYLPVGTAQRWFVQGPIKITSQYYTNDIDAREEYGVRLDMYTYKGTDMGYPFCGFITDHYTTPVANYGAGDRSITRQKLFYKEVASRFGTYRLRAAAIAVPFWFRDSMMVAEKTRDYLRDGTDRWGWQFVADPNGGIEKVGDGDNNLDVLTTTAADTVSEIYALTKDFADEGVYLSVGVPLEEQMYGALPNSNEGETTFIPGSDVGKLTVTMVANSDHSPRLMKQETRNPDEGWAPLWFLPSPHPDTGDVQYIEATKNSFGDAEVLVHQEDINVDRRVTVGSPEDSDFVTRLPIFVGVVHA